MHCQRKDREIIGRIRKNGDAEKPAERKCQRLVSRGNGHFGDFQSGTKKRDQRRRQRRFRGNRARECEKPDDRSYYSGQNEPDKDSAIHVSFR